MSFAFFEKQMVLLLLAGMLAFPAWAWPFGRSEAKPRERRVAKLSASAGADFSHAVALRQQRAEEIRVLTRLVSEKTGEIAGFDAAVAKLCALSSDAAYSYNPTNRTVYLISTNAANGATATAPVLLPHHAFATEAEADDFLRSIGAKQITLRQIETFKEVIREKRQEYALTDKYLADHYGISSARQYRFDEKTGELFEIVPAESGAAKKPPARREDAGKKPASTPPPPKKASPAAKKAVE